MSVPSPRGWKAAGWKAAGPWLAIAMLLLGVLPAAGCRSDGSAGREPAPDFEVRLYDTRSGGTGETVRLSDLKGSLVVLNFWAEWCGPCKTEMPTLDAVQKSLIESGDRVTVLGVDMGVSENPPDQATIEFLKEIGISFPVGTPLDIGLGVKYGVTGLPVTVLVDPRGFIVDRWMGAITREGLLDAIQREMKAGTSGS